MHLLRGDERLLLRLGASRLSSEAGRLKEVPVRLECQRLDEAASLPAYAREGDAALDLTCIEDVEVAPGERAMVETGIAVAIPEGYAGLVLPRSGLAARKGLTLANSPGLVDPGYRGELTCAVVNLDRRSAVSIRRGDRIAQLLIVPAPSVQAVWVEGLPASQRGTGGFGSTGR